MGFFDSLYKSLNDTVQNLEKGFQKYKNRDMLNALMATCAIVSAADGTITADEKRKMVGLVRNSSIVNMFGTDEAIEVFNKFAGQFEFDYEIGKMEALQAVGKFRGKSEQARLIIRAGVIIGNADGNLDNDERKALKEIVLELGENPADFDLADTTASTHKGDRIRLGGNN